MKELAKITVIILFAALWVSTEAEAGNYQTCIKWQIQTVDSSKALQWGPNAGLIEDRYKGCDGTCSVVARGVRAKVSRGSWSQTFDAHPTSGCFDWSHPSSSGFSVRVYAYATNSHDLSVRVHDGSTTNFSSYPGSTYSYLLTNVSPTHNGSNTYYVGGYTQQATLMATAAFTTYRINVGNHDKRIHISLNTGSCWSSSSAYGTNTGSTQQVTSGRHYVRLGSCATGTPSTRRKFMVSHELGHALLRLYTNKNGDDPGQSSSHNVNPNACGTGGTSYNIGSKEWNSKGYKEGFAHLVSARTWNDWNEVGIFRWSNTTYSLERYAASTSSGGRLENVCCTSGCATSWQNAGTIEDWMRFFWDVYTEDDDCTDHWTIGKMFALYDKVRDNGGLTSTNHFSRARTAATQLGLTTCSGSTLFDSRAAWNGVNN